MNFFLLSFLTFLSLSLSISLPAFCFIYFTSRNVSHLPLLSPSPSLPCLATCYPTSPPLPYSNAAMTFRFPQSPTPSYLPTHDSPHLPVLLKRTYMLVPHLQHHHHHHHRISLATYISLPLSSISSSLPPIYHFPPSQCCHYLSPQPYRLCITHISFFYPPFQVLTPSLIFFFTLLYTLSFSMNIIGGFFFLHILLEMR